MGEYKPPDLEGEAREEAFFKMLCHVVGFIQDLWNVSSKNAPIIWKKLNTRIFFKRYSMADVITATLIACIIVNVGPITLFSFIVAIAFFLAFVHQIHLRKGIWATKTMVNLVLSAFFLWRAGLLF